MRYVSTRGAAGSFGSAQAVLAGLAPDGGLFVPERLPEPIAPASLGPAGYAGIAKRILEAFFPDLSASAIAKAVAAAYPKRFDTAEVVPVRELSDCLVAELWHGPTAAFKDLALTVLPGLTAAAAAGKRAIILTATSGDTGKAALSGFADVPGTALIVLYPKDGVAAVQELQMLSSPGKNVAVIGVRGNFDDCQRIVKAAFADPGILKAAGDAVITSANSINIGRLVPQIAYYYSAYLAAVRLGWASPGGPVDFVVPTGNFGDVFAGWLAKQLGLPVNKLIAASNANHVVADFLASGIYQAGRKLVPTISPSMDILVSSNLERLLYYTAAGGPRQVKGCLEGLRDCGSYSVPADQLARIRQDFAGYWADDEACREVIRQRYEREGYLADPHTATALAALRKYRQAGAGRVPAIVLATASPYKFADSVLAALGQAGPAGYPALAKLEELTGQRMPGSLKSLAGARPRFSQTVSAAEGLGAIKEKVEELAHA